MQKVCHVAHADLLQVDQVLYKPNRLALTNLTQEQES